ncbi:hypothetical protein KEM52_006333 [Ascosphaera acerosa]|nr:hypothetical protein KEM52_006333 [Ascosphaera acerosa]
MSPAPAAAPEATMTLPFLRTGIHGFAETIGIDTDEIRLYWAYKPLLLEVRQLAYRIVVAESKDALAPSTLLASHSHGAARRAAPPVVFDSGMVMSDAQRNVPVAAPNGGAGFRSTTPHFYRIIVWDEDEAVSYSGIGEFYTAYPRCSGLLPPYSMNQTYMPHSSLIFRTWFEDEANRWGAVWIGDGGDKPIYLRKTIAATTDKTKGVAKVIAFASGLGHFNLTINGQRPKYHGKKHMLDPGWTNYHRTVQFVAYDLTPHWNAPAEGPAANVVGAHVGNGFYAGDKGAADRFFWPMYEDNTYVRYGNELCFFAEIHIHYSDGSHEVVISDPSWKVRKSATSLANIYSSEDCDLRDYPIGWDSPDYVDPAGEWRDAKPVTGPRGRLRYQSQPPVVLHQKMKPKVMKEVRPGVVRCDLGQNASIHLSLSLRGGIAGSEIIVRFSETIDSQTGELIMPDPLFSMFQTGVYHRITIAARGTAATPERWEPDFCFTSARYIQIEGVTLPATGEAAQNSRLPVLQSLRVNHISSASRHLGSVVTDKEDVNALINACAYTFSSNLFSYHTDCPQIEKFGWLEVTTLLFPATQYIRDTEALYAKILDDIIDAQEPNGLVPTMAPEMRYMAGPLHDTISWGCAIALLPELIKTYYGWTGVIPKVYDAAARYMHYMKTRERRGGLIEHGLGDWGYGIAFGNHQANIETAVYYRCLKACEMMAGELGRGKKEVQRWSTWAKRIYDVYNRELLVTDTSEYGYAYYTSLDDHGQRDRTMVAQAVALQSGLVPAAHRQDIIDAFIAAAEDSNNVMKAGELGLRYLWTTLAMPEVNRPDIVLAMARQEEHPSYMRFLRRGETTLSEFWQDACRSKCHDMLGTIYEWFYSYVLGITPTKEGYKEWKLRPPVNSEFQQVKGTIDCPYGRIGVSYRKEGATVYLNVEVPTSTECTVEAEDLLILAKGWDEDGSVNQTAGALDHVRLSPGRFTVEVGPNRSTGGMLPFVKPK